MKWDAIKEEFRSKSLEYLKAAYKVYSEEHVFIELIPTLLEVIKEKETPMETIHIDDVRFENNIIFAVARDNKCLNILVKNSDKYTWLNMKTLRLHPANHISINNAIKYIHCACDVYTAPTLKNALYFNEKVVNFPVDNPPE